MTQDTHPAVAPSPVWTPDLLRTAMRAVLPLGISGASPDPAAVAAATAILTRAGERSQVSPRTVRRWLQPVADPAVASKIPTRRLEAFLTVARPTAGMLAREAAAAGAALESRMLIEKPRGRGILPSWRDQGWLEPWMLQVVEISGWELRRAKIEHVDPASPVPPTQTPTRDHHRRRHPITAYSPFPNRFAAEIAKHELLARMSEWRIVVPKDRRIEGRTQTWLAAAPLPDLSSLAHEAPTEAGRA